MADWYVYDWDLQGLPAQFHVDLKYVEEFDALGDFDKMKKAPKDYPADFPDIDLLKYRSYIVSKNMDDQDIVRLTGR